MAFWSSERLTASGNTLIFPFRPDRVKHAAYELAVGPEAFISSSPDGRKLSLGPYDDVPIPSGQFALVLTEEEVAVPPDALGLISMRYGVKSRGLVNISGFHVDPGFRGRLKFAVYNAGPQEITITRGDRVFLLWLADLDTRTADEYPADPKRFAHITSRDQNRLHGDLASPAQLKKGIANLKHQLTNVAWVAGVLVAAALAILLKTDYRDEELRAVASRVAELERAVASFKQAESPKAPRVEAATTDDESTGSIALSGEVQEPANTQ